MPWLSDDYFTLHDIIHATLKLSQSMLTLYERKKSLQQSVSAVILN